MPPARRFVPAAAARRTAGASAAGRAWLAALPGVIAGRAFLDSGERLAAGQDGGPAG